MILVTGANGFVGRELCAELARRDYKVCGSVRHFSHASGLSCEIAVTGDIGPSVDWAKALRTVDSVVHLAARVHLLRETASDPLSVFRMTNTGGATNLAKQAARAGVSRFVYISSIKVNGEQTLPNQPFTEQDVPAPLDPYGISKYEAEEELRNLAQQTGMEVVIIRPPLVYGPGVRANFLNMMSWLHKGVPLPFGAINNCRSLIALDNLVDLIITCLEHPAAANQVFLASDGRDLSTTELLRQMAKALNMPVRLLPIPHKFLEVGFKMVGKVDLAQRLCGSLQVDITKACIMLGWKPLISVDEGLHRTAEFFLRSRG